MRITYSLLTNSFHILVFTTVESLCHCTTHYEACFIKSTKGGLGTSKRIVCKLGALKPVSHGVIFVAPKVQFRLHATKINCTSQPPPLQHATNKLVARCTDHNNQLDASTKK